MDRNKQLQIVLAVVVLLFIITAASAIFKPRPKESVPPPEAPEEAVEEKTEKPQERRMSSFPDWGRDPFTVGTTPVKLDGDLVLTGIVWDDKKPYCIINEKLVKVGDTVYGYKVTRINKDSVYLKAGEQVRILKIGRK